MVCDHRKKKNMSTIAENFFIPLQLRAMIKNVIFHFLLIQLKKT